MDNFKRPRHEDGAQTGWSKNLEWVEAAPEVLQDFAPFSIPVVSALPAYTTFGTINWLTLQNTDLPNISAVLHEVVCTNAYDRAYVFILALFQLLAEITTTIVAGPTTIVASITGTLYCSVQRIQMTPDFMYGNVYGMVTEITASNSSSKETNINGRIYSAVAQIIGGSNLMAAISAASAYRKDCFSVPASYSMRHFVAPGSEAMQPTRYSTINLSVPQYAAVPPGVDFAVVNNGVTMNFTGVTHVITLQGNDCIAYNTGTQPVLNVGDTACDVYHYYVRFEPATSSAVQLIVVPANPTYVAFNSTWVGCVAIHRASTSRVASVGREISLLTNAPANTRVSLFAGLNGNAIVGQVTGITEMPPNLLALMPSYKTFPATPATAQMTEAALSAINDRGCCTSRRITCTTTLQSRGNGSSNAK